MAKQSKQSDDTIINQGPKAGGSGVDVNSGGNPAYRGGPYYPNGYGYPPAGYAPPAPAKDNKKLITILLSIIIILLVVMLIFILTKSKKEGTDSTSAGSVDQTALAIEKARADSLLRVEEERKAEAERQKAEAERLEAERRAEAARMNSATGVYRGNICGVRAKLTLNQNGTSLSGSYQGNSRHLTVYGSVDNGLNFDIYIEKSGVTEAHVTGSISGKKMSGWWEEYLTGNSYSFSLTR